MLPRTRLRRYTLRDMALAVSHFMAHYTDLIGSEEY
jgi:hypothetical protein